MSLSFVIASKSDESSEAKLAGTIAGIRQVRGGDDEIVVIRDAPSMAVAYNEGANRSKNNRICFTHNDVGLRASEYWDDVVLDALFKKFPVGFLGVAGSKDLFPDGRWYVDGNRMAGACFHGQFYAPDQPAPQGAIRLPDGRSYLEWYTAYGDFGRVVVLDGVLLISTKELLEEIGGFDEDSYPKAWHYYDLDASLRAHLAGRHNITIPAFVRHLSVGSFNDQWSLTKGEFLKKWDGKLPVVLDFEEDYVVESLRNIQLRQAGPADKIVG